MRGSAIAALAPPAPTVLRALAGNLKLQLRAQGPELRFPRFIGRHDEQPFRQRQTGDLDEAIRGLGLDLGGKPLSIETGKIAKQAAGAAVVRYGDTVVLVTVTTATPREGIDFFPLTVDYVEKYSAAGKIPGGFFKREARLSDREILVCRFIDRACRPLFAEGYRDETQIIATVLAADGENPADIPAFIGASAALSISDVPFLGPIAAVRLAKIDGQLVVNPTSAQREPSST